MSKQVKVFMSHSKLDKDTCNRFDSAAARVGIEVFRSEYESMKTPAWETIKNEIKQSEALFLLIGPKLVESQNISQNIFPVPNWKYTQNWIAYEVGLACALDKDVWVVCDGITINFPVPYLNNYTTERISAMEKGFIAQVLAQYRNKKVFRLGWNNTNISCKNEYCGATFNLHNKPQGGIIVCPTCLEMIVVIPSQLFGKDI